MHIGIVSAPQLRQLLSTAHTIPFLDGDVINIGIDRQKIVFVFNHDDRNLIRVRGNRRYGSGLSRGDGCAGAAAMSIPSFLPFL